MGMCEDCKHWNDDMGECRKNAPPWPQTEPDDSCGDFDDGSRAAAKASPTPNHKTPPPDATWVDAMPFIGQTVYTSHGPAQVPPGAEWLSPHSGNIVRSDGHFYAWDGALWVARGTGQSITLTPAGQPVGKAVAKTAPAPTTMAHDMVNPTNPGWNWTPVGSHHGARISTPKGTAKIPDWAKHWHMKGNVCDDAGRVYEFDGADYLHRGTPHGQWQPQVWASPPPDPKSPAGDPFLNRGLHAAQALQRALTGQAPVDTDPDAMRRRIERATRDLSGG